MRASMGAQIDAETTPGFAKARGCEASLETRVKFVETTE
jgi:hypothetical protein